ncbi:MAG: chromate transporter [Lachnospiraceae bacterium]|nr:chromate transporter [uncultured Acetatifactor sp.]MCI8286063.1 chromate transporter [Lachnospiraceae bacterium]
MKKEEEKKEEGKKAGNKLWILFKSMFVLSACTFGGGFVIVSLMKKKYVEELKWLDEDEMLDVTAITQSSPGPLPVNASVIIGYRMAGVTGSLAAIAGTILPPMVIISVISLFYEQFRTNPYIAVALQVMRAGVAAVIFDVVLNLAGNVMKTKRILYIGMMVTAFVATYFFDISAMLVILTCLGIGLADMAVTMRKKKGTEA